MKDFWPYLKTLLENENNKKEPESPINKAYDCEKKIIKRDNA